MANDNVDPLEYGLIAARQPADTVARAGADVIDAGAQAAKPPLRVLQGDDVVDVGPEIEEICVAPGQLALPLPARSRREYSSVLGAFAERWIDLDYCRLENCQPYTVEKSLRYDFFDYRTRLRDLIGYYRMFNPALTDDDEKKMRKAARKRGQFRRPDIIRHTTDIQQMFEIKPDSRSGRSSGRRKLRDLDRTYKRFGLPYTRGTFYDPSEEIPITTVKVDEFEIELFIKAFRNEAGLVIYLFCMRGELTRASRRIAKKLRLLALMGLLIGAVIPIENPVEQPIRDPKEDPFPEPVPIPIPASVETKHVVPVPYYGTVGGEFTFHYARGLSRNAKRGDVYPITIRYLSEGDTYRTVVNFRLKRVKNNVSFLESANKTILNIAPAGHEPLLIPPKTKLNVTWRNR